MYSNIDKEVANIKIDKIFFFGFKNEKTKVETPQNNPKNNGIKINAIGTNGLKFSSKVSELVIQYKLEIKYPNPNIQPILKDIHFPFLQFKIKKINNKGKVIKFIKKKL